MRPQKFEEVVGQEITVKILLESLNAGKVGSVYFFSGPAGIGKTTIARLVAKALNCEHLEGELICDKCNVCVTIKEDRSELVLEIDGATNRGIGEVNAIQDITRRVPPMGKHKVIIIDEVHGLTPQAFEALLKTLEEPPPFIHFILCTTLPFKVPDTVRSRGLQFHFRSVKEEEINRIITPWKLSDNVKDLLRRKSKGNVRDLYFMLEQLESCESLNEEELMELLGVVGNRDVKSLVQAFYAGWETYLLEVKRLKSVYSVNVVANLVKDVLHDCCLASISTGLESNCGLPLEELKGLSSSLPLEGVKVALRELMDIYESTENLDVALDLVPFFVTSNGVQNQQVVNTPLASVKQSPLKTSNDIPLKTNEKKNTVAPLGQNPKGKDPLMNTILVSLKGKIKTKGGE
jgi:DNA polymerase III subunit gamma/tau